MTTGDMKERDEALEPGTPDLSHTSGDDDDPTTPDAPPSDASDSTANQASDDDASSDGGSDDDDDDDGDDGEDSEDGGKRARPKTPVDPELVKALQYGFESYVDLPLHPRVKEGLAKMGWTTPTPVQKLCLPFTLVGRDVAGFAQTGTGKTGVFLITIVNRLLQATPTGTVDHKAPRAIVLAPTRELAMQIEDEAKSIFEFTGVRSLAVFGGIDYDKQAQSIKEGVDVIVATPGRLKDYVQKKWVDLRNIELFVCDEADRMFDMGFIEDVEFFLEKIPEHAQKLLFSATTNDEVKELAFEYLESPEYISVTPDVITPERIEQHAIHCHATQKLRVMLGMLREHQPARSIIFTNTKLTAEWLHFKLEGNGIECDQLTGDLPQKKRIRLIQRIKEGKLKALIATDVASRGLHIAGVTHVYNFDLPDDPSNYIHRIGRTARAGAKGSSYSLVCDDYGQNLAPINELLGDARVQSEWYDEKYMEIEDKAGNPFEERYKAREAEIEARKAAARAEREARRGPRPDGRGERGERDGRFRDRDEKRPQAQQGQASEGRRDRGDRAQQQSRHGARLDERAPRSQHQQQGQRQGASQHGTAMAKSGGLFGMIKRFFNMLFGRKPQAAASEGRGGQQDQRGGRQGDGRNRGPQQRSGQQRHSQQGHSQQQGQGRHGQGPQGGGGRRDGGRPQPDRGQQQGPRGDRGPRSQHAGQQQRGNGHAGGEQQHGQGQASGGGRKRRRRRGGGKGGENRPTNEPQS